nr:hypothetical protein RKQZWNHN_RKQZWNHN_CDS_0012 [Microvirus sp.]CAI9751553.1 hypothetical protein PTLEEYKN_PTLEEYKN_CDS_0012 [Microvirus sp.]
MSIWSSIWKGVKKVGSTVGSWFGGKKSSSSSFKIVQSVVHWL